MPDQFASLRKLNPKVLTQEELVQPHPLAVRTFLCDGTETRKVIDFHSPADRKWLASHCWWAIHSGHSVLTHSA